MGENNKYSFSFVALSLGRHEMIMVGQAILRNFNVTAEEIGRGKISTGKRKLNEVNKRIRTLTPKQLQLLVEGDLTVQKRMAFLSVCKAHLFIRDFTVEMIREKLSVYDYRITEGDYNTFFRRKADLFPEINHLTEMTRRKVRQVTFKILEQSGIIDNVKNKIIQPQILEEDVTNAIVDDNKEWLKIFLLSDEDISQYYRKRL